MTDPEKTEAEAPPKPVPAKQESDDLPDDLKLSPEPEGDIEKLVERGRQMGF